MFSKCTAVNLTVDEQRFDQLPIAPINNQFSNQEYAHYVKITFIYETATYPATKVEISYEIDNNGHIIITLHYFGKKGLPPIPVIGMRFIMPTKAIGFKSDGLSSETYPDRMAGGKQGIFKVNGLPVTKYLVPQENGMHMHTN